MNRWWIPRREFLAACALLLAALYVPGYILFDCFHVDIAAQPLKFKLRRDTVAWFSEGRYQLLRSGSEVALADMDQDKTMLRPVTDWWQSGDWLYAYGSRGPAVYLVLNTRTAAHKPYPRLEDVPQPHRVQAAKLATQPGKARFWHRRWR
jgi:hypothetical protein